jgi:hypothetical protein
VLLRCKIQIRKRDPQIIDAGKGFVTCIKWENREEGSLKGLNIQNWIEAKVRMMKP